MFRRCCSSTNMSLELRPVFLLALIGFTACQSLTEDGTIAPPDTNATDTNGPPSLDGSSTNESITLGNVTVESSSTEITTPTSIATTMTDSSTTAEASSSRTTRRRRNPYPKGNGKYGILYDRKDCQYKVLESSGLLYTATCLKKCRGRYSRVQDGNGCLIALRKSSRKGKRKCVLGTCSHGQCKSIGKNVRCKAPKGTIHYYDDGYNYDYYDDNNYSYGESYDSYNYEDYDDSHGKRDNFAE